MRNRALHDALRDFALEAASLLTDELRDGAEIEFDVVDEGGGRGPALYRYRPRTAEFVAARWEGLRALPACSRAGVELGTGAALWLRVNGMDGEKAEPALRAMLERLYEDATSFGFPEDRFARLYLEVEQTLYQGVQHAVVAVPLRGVGLDCDRVDFGDGVSLVRGDRAGLPAEVAWAEEGPLPEAVVLVQRDTSATDPIQGADVEEAAGRIVTAMRLLRAGAASVSPVAWRRTGESRWSALALNGDAGARGDLWVLGEDEAEELLDLVKIVTEDPLRNASAWALRRFELGCAQPTSEDALSDYLLALRSLMDATNDAGEASLALRVAALCAEEGERRTVQRRIELAVSLERFAMHGGGHLEAELRSESAPQLVAELEGHLRALLRDMLCGYLDADLKSVADDILLEAREPFEIEVKDTRAEAMLAAAAVPVATAAAPAAAPSAPRDREWFEEPLAADVVTPAVEPEPEPYEDPGPEPLSRREWFDEEPQARHPVDELFEEDADTEEVPALVVAPPVDEPQQSFEGVTPSADWAYDDPEDFSAPV